jgi:hypothetical protein
MTVINTGPVPAFRDVPPPHPAESALRELAQEFGVPSNVGDMHRIKLVIAGDRCRLQAEIHRLEATLGVLRAHTVPTLEGELRKAQMDAEEWAAQAKRTARGLFVSLVALVALAAFVSVAVSAGVLRW